MQIQVNIRGTREVVAALERLGVRAKSLIAAAIYQEAELIMGDSKENYVPVDTGALKGSGHVQLPSIVGNEITVMMGFGGPAVDYAIHVHENLHVRHRVGQAKYLETPALIASRDMGDRLAERLRADLT